MNGIDNNSGALTLAEVSGVVLEPGPRKKHLKSAPESEKSTKRVSPMYEEIQRVSRGIAELDQNMQSLEERCLGLLSTSCETQNSILSLFNRLFKDYDLILKPEHKPPFLEDVARAAEIEKVRREELMLNTDIMLKELNACSDTSKRLRGESLTVKQKIVDDATGKKVVTKPQEKLSQELQDHIAALDYVLEAVPTIRKQIAKELKKLTPYYKMLTKEQQNYHDEISRKGNEILLAANRLPSERDLIKDALSLLPEMKDLNASISTSAREISGKKDNYQTAAYKGEINWAEVQTCMTEEQVKFEKYQDEALKQEKTLQELRTTLNPLEMDENAFGAFFAHNETMKANNLQNWKGMEAQINKDRGELKTMLINQWKLLYTDLDEYSTQIAHIGAAEHSKGFGYKFSITNSFLSWLNQNKATYAPVKIKNV